LQKKEGMACIDIKEQDDKIVVRIMKNPENVDELNKFLARHEDMLLHSQPNSKLLLFDVTALRFDAFTMTICVPIVVAHFVRMRPVSDAKLKGCSVVVENEYAAKFIQGCIDRNPGKVPTFLSTDIEKCKEYLKLCRNKKK
jgi:hypothetical protein